MIPFSTNILYPIGSNVRTGRIHPRIFQRVRAFTVISLIAIFGFVPSLPTRQGGTLAGSLLPEPSDTGNVPALRGNQIVKISKKVTYAFPAPQVHQPVTNEYPNFIRSVLVPLSFSYAVVQQPDDNPYYVSSSKDLVTEFNLARQYNNSGLLAHNNLAGSKFKNLAMGQKIYIVREDGHVDRYTVSAIHRFQALESTNTESSFVDLDTGKTFSAVDVFNQMYTGARHLTLQTCISAMGDASWGRLFVIATPDV